MLRTWKSPQPILRILHQRQPANTRKHTSSTIPRRTRPNRNNAGQTAISRNKRQIHVFTDDTTRRRNRFFSPEHIQKYNQNQLDVKFYGDFTDYLCTQAGYSRSGCGANGKTVYSQVMAHISTPDKEYIIKPNEGLIN